MRAIITKLAAVATLFCANIFVPAYAEENSAIKTFKSDETLSAAARDILSMDLSELNAFADYLAICHERLGDNPIILNNCNVANEKFVIKYGRDRPLDDMMNSIWVVTFALRAASAAGKKTDIDLIFRLSHVQKRLKIATNIAFRGLDGQKKPN